MKNTAELEGKKAGVGIGVIVLLIAGIALWSKREAVAAVFKPDVTGVTPLTDPSLSLEAAPAAAATYLDSIAAKYSDDTGLLSQITQAKASIALDVAQGISPAEDPGAATFSGHLAAYDAYRADGGTASFNDFSLFSIGRTEKYQAIIDSYQQAFTVREADAVIKTMTLHDAYGVPTGGLSGNLEAYMEQQPKAVREELLTRPEVIAALAPAPAPPPAAQAEAALAASLAAAAAYPTGAPAVPLSSGDIAAVQAQYAAYYGAYYAPPPAAAPGYVPYSFGYYYSF